MIRLEMKNYNMILIEKHPKYHLYHQAKFINMNILLVKIYCHLINSKLQISQIYLFSFGKAFEKQIKTIEDQGEKQIKAIQDQGQVKTIKKYAYDAEDTPFISKQKEIFNQLVDERREKITDLDKKVNSNDLIYRYKGNTAHAKCGKFNNALNIIIKIQNGKISIADVKNNRERFKTYLREIKKGNKKHRSKEQKNTLYNIEMLYKARNEAIKFYDDYSLIMSEAKTKAKAIKGTGLKILTPKQMLQRLPIALAQVKAGNNSESLLNEIRQIVYSLYQSKQITKKVYNNIIKSINI